MHAQRARETHVLLTLLALSAAPRPSLAQTPRPEIPKSERSIPMTMPRQAPMTMPMPTATTPSPAPNAPRGGSGMPMQTLMTMPRQAPMTMPMPTATTPGPAPTAPRGGSSMPMPSGEGAMAMPAGPRTENTTPAPAGLTLTQLDALALQYNPTLIQAQAQVDASLSKSLQAGLLPNPIAGYVSEQMGTGGGLGETQGWFAEQEVPRGGKLRLSRAKYRQEAVQAQMQVQTQQLRVLNGVRTHLYEVLAAQRLLAVEKHLLTNFDEMLVTTRELVNIGQANRPDLLNAQIATQRQRVTVRATENRLRQRWIELATVIGVRENALGPLADVLDQDGPRLDFETEYQHIREASPELAVARAEVLRDQITVQRERVQPVPNLFARIENGYNWEENMPTVGVQLGWSLPVLNRNQGTISEAMAEVARARAEVTRLELLLRRRLAETFAHYETALTTVAIYRAETLPQAREAFELTLDGYHERRMPWAHVVLAQRTLSDLSEDYIEAVLELRKSEVAIRGMLLADGLSLPEPPTPGGHIDATPQPR